MTFQDDDVKCPELTPTAGSKDVQAFPSIQMTGTSTSFVDHPVNGVLTLDVVLTGPGAANIVVTPDPDDFSGGSPKTIPMNQNHH